MIHGWLLQADYGSQDTFYFIRGDGLGVSDRRGRKARALLRFLKTEMPDLPNKVNEMVRLFPKTVKASLDAPNAPGELRGVGAINFHEVFTEDGRFSTPSDKKWGWSEFPITKILGSGNARMVLKMDEGLQLKYPLFIV